MAMTRHVDQETMNAEIAERTEQQRIRESFARYFRWKLESVRFPRRGLRLRGVIYFVKLRVGIGSEVEFMATRGQLIGIPPKKRWER